MDIKIKRLNTNASHDSQSCNGFPFSLCWSFKQHPIKTHGGSRLHLAKKKKKVHMNILKMKHF